MLHETDAPLVLTAQYTDPPGIWGSKFSLHRSGGSAFYVPDMQGNSRVLTDATGAVTDTLLSNAWGVEVASTGTTANPYRAFGAWGYERDAASRLYVRARHLRVDLGRWASRDPFGIRAGDGNLYWYVSDLPTRAADPTGLVSIGLPAVGVACMGRISGPVEDRRNPPPDLCKGHSGDCRSVYMTCDPKSDREDSVAMYCRPEWGCGPGRCACNPKKRSAKTSCGDFCKDCGCPLGVPPFPRFNDKHKPNTVCVYGITHPRPQPYKTGDCGCGQLAANKPQPDVWMDIRVSNCGNFEQGWRCVCFGACP